MLQFRSVMIGTNDPEALAKFYEKVFEKPADMHDGEYYGWAVGEGFFSFGKHSEIKGNSKEPARTIFNFETEEVKEEFERIKGFGAEVVKEPYEMGGMWIATFADPDGNYFQLMTPWEGEKSN